MAVALPDNLLVETLSGSSSDWLGAFYPPNPKPGQFIEAYARRFRAVEIDSTYDNIPAPQRLPSGVHDFFETYRAARQPARIAAVALSLFNRNIFPFVNPSKYCSSPLRIYGTKATRGEVCLTGNWPTTYVLNPRL